MVLAISLGMRQRCLCFAASPGGGCAAFGVVGPGVVVLIRCGLRAERGVECRLQIQSHDHVYFVTCLSNVDIRQQQLQAGARKLIDITTQPLISLLFRADCGVNLGKISTRTKVRLG